MRTVSSLHCLSVLVLRSFTLNLSVSSFPFLLFPCSIRPLSSYLALLGLVCLLLSVRVHQVVLCHFPRSFLHFPAGTKVACKFAKTSRDSVQFTHAITAEIQNKTSTKIHINHHHFSLLLIFFYLTQVCFWLDWSA